jgi:hypothetical protein
VSEVERGPPPDNAVSKRVYDMIGDIQTGTIGQRDRGDLRKALDKADAPLTGRAASDGAIRGMTRPTPKATP